MSTEAGHRGTPVYTKYSYDPTVIAKSVSAGLAILDRDLRIEWVNEAYERWFGRLNAIKGKKCYNVYGRRVLICPECPALKVLQHGLNAYTSLQRDVPVAHGPKRYFRITVSPVKDDRGNVIKVLQLIEDVTQEAKADKEAKRKLDVISRELDFIAKLDRQFIYSQALSLDAILREAIEIAPSLVNAKMCNLRLVNPLGRTLTTRASKGLSKEYTKNVVMEIGEGIVGRVAETKKPVIIKDMLAEQGTKFIGDIKKEGIHSSICVPIVLKGEVLGVLTVYDKKVGAFVDDDQRLLMNFANHVAILIDNIRVHKRVFISYVNTIKSLASAVEVRDSYTRGHSEKVTKFALYIANALGLPKEEKLMLTYCGRLHDIGKIAVSDAILNKRGKLTLAERAEIELHPLKAVEILSNLNFMERGIPVIKHHHERYDGKGYPDGLKGQDIPMLARIIGCADAFDAMTSDRAYRSKMSIKDAMAELEANRGKQFDPELLDIFIEILKGKSG